MLISLPSVVDPAFPRRRRQPQRWEVLTYYFGKFFLKCMKTPLGFANDNGVIPVNDVECGQEMPTIVE